MQRIHLKNMKEEGKPLGDIINILKTSDRSYQHLALSNLWFSKNEVYSQVPSHINLKSIKLSVCSFQTARELVKLLSSLSPETLIETEFYRIQIQTSSNDEILSVCFPWLKKLKADTSDLKLNFICWTLKVLEIIDCGSDCSGSCPELVLDLMRRNSQIEELTIGQGENLFVRSIEEQNIHLNLKKLRFSCKGINVSQRENFEAFLMSQRNSVKLDLEDQILATCLRTLLSEFQNLKKLVVNNNKQALTKEESSNSLQLPTNSNITELRLRFGDGVLSQLVARKLITACPNVKRLFMFKMTQPILEYFSANMPNIETIYALSLTANVLPHPAARFENLRNVKFYECNIKSQSEISRMKWSEQKAAVAKLLS